MELADVKSWVKLTQYHTAAKILLSLIRVPSDQPLKREFKDKAQFEAEALQLELDSFTEFTANSRLEAIFALANKLTEALELLQENTSEDFAVYNSLFD